jgi:diguanylate cyclase (GGDEF)-like protein
VLAFVDVDGLKAINDRAGHAVGDLVLRTLVATMRSSLRPFDPIVRYGGDEFVCAVGGVGIDEVLRRFDAIRHSLYADTGASISVGMASLAEQDTLHHLLVRADAMLLDAKRARQTG